MNAPWRGDLSHRPLSESRTKIADIIDDGGTPIAYDIPSSQARALVHRANTYPKLVEALETALEFIDDAQVTDGQWHWLDSAREALASTREEG